MSNLFQTPDEAAISRAIADIQSLRDEFPGSIELVAVHKKLVAAHDHIVAFPFATPVTEAEIDRAFRQATIGNFEPDLS